MLERWFACPKFYAVKIREINEYKEMLENVTDIKPQALTGMPKGNTTSDPTQRAAERLATLKEHVAEEIDYLSTEIESMLDFDMAMRGCVRSLNQTEITIIDMKYHGGKQYEQIAREIGYCEDHVKRLERGAIDKLIPMISIEIQ